MPLHRPALQRQPVEAGRVGREPRRRPAQAAQGGHHRGRNDLRFDQKRKVEEEDIRHRHWDEI